MNVREALDLRKKLVAIEGRTSPTSSVIGEILRGTYDKYKEGAHEVAKDDIEFLKGAGK